MRELKPPEGRVYVGCEQCGMVTTVILASGEELPWCLHHETQYSWRGPSTATQRTPRAWKQMVRVLVLRPMTPTERLVDVLVDKALND